MEKRYIQLLYKPTHLTRSEAREIVQLERLIGERVVRLSCASPIIDEDPHPDGAPPPPIYY